MLIEAKSIASAWGGRLTMNPKSDNLFHFTRSRDSLKGILLNGFMPRYCLEDVGWLAIGDKFMAYPMTCFCDIPISRIGDHTGFYGNYGLGLTKDWGLKNGLTPLVYASPGSAATTAVNYLINLRFDGLPDADARAKENGRNMYGLLTLIKPIKGNIWSGGVLTEKEFYQENEWRYVPSAGNAIFERDFATEKDARNKEMEAHKLGISPNDIRYIFVPDDTEIPVLVDFIDKEMGHFPHNDLKMLTTRLISLETIAKDF
jgi:hypothetical protein